MPQLHVRTELPSAQGGVIDLISGHPVFARAWRGRAHRGVVLCLHGAESHSGWFNLVAGALQASDLDVFAYDRMGWGQSPGDTGELASLHDIYDELCSLIYILRESYDRIHLLGMSWGGLYALYAGHHLLPIVNSISVISPGLFLRFPFDRGSFKYTLLEIMKNRHWRFNLTYLPEDFCSDPKQAKFVEEDPWRLKSVGPRFVAATLWMQSVIRSPLFKRPQGNFYVLLGDQDRMIHIQRTADFCDEKELSFKTLAGGHTLILDNPLEVARHLAKVDGDSIFEEPLELRKVD